MNILCVSQTYPSDAYPTKVVFVHEQVKALIEGGHNVVVLDIDMRSLRWKRRYGIYIDEYDGVTVCRASFPIGVTKFTPMSIVKYLSEIVGLRAYNSVLGKFEFELIVAHFAFEAGHAARQIKKQTELPLLVIEHSSDFIRNGRSLEVLKDVYLSADCCVAVSQYLAEKISNRYEIAVGVLSNLVDADRFKIIHNISKDRGFTFISVGRLIKWKQFDLLIAAFSRLANQHDDATLIIAGTGEEEENLRAQINELGLSERITLVGNVKNSDLPMLYNRCHAFVLPSRGETFGVVYIEAMACGIPVITFKNGGPEEFIDSYNGVITRTNDEEGLYEALESMYTNIKHYNPTKISNSVRERFGKKHYCNNIEEIAMRITKK